MKPKTPSNDRSSGKITVQTVDFLPPCILRSLSSLSRSLPSPNNTWWQYRKITA
ncbi:hypothetical protein HanPSC8_Chr06g0238931 [Helianthus annuus]|nr:hypothetical protein HanPSC8_Chr06g0238931 [Helianthus annuus]